jgi:precorrin-6A/cobalt-precorrin-6A reductase
MMVDQRTRILVLGGSHEGEELVSLLRERPGIETVLVRPPRSVGGDPRQPALHLLIETRGDLQDLMARAAAVVIAAHPFSGRFVEVASEVAEEMGLPCLRLVREPWRPGPQDLWTIVDSPKSAVAELIRHGWQRPLLSLGREQLTPFLVLTGRDIFIRVPGSGPPPAVGRGHLLTDPGPFSVGSEMELFRKNRIDSVIARNIGGRGGWPKLQAARGLRLPVILIRRPAGPSIDVRHDAGAAADWLGRRLGLDLGATVA